MTDLDKQDRISVNEGIEARARGPLRMRFSVDPDTTRRLKRLQVDPEPPIPWWRRLLRRLKGDW